MFGPYNNIWENDKEHHRVHVQPLPETFAEPEAPFYSLEMVYTLEPPAVNTSVVQCKLMNPGSIKQAIN